MVGLPRTKTSPGSGVQRRNCPRPEQFLQSIIQNIALEIIVKEAKTGKFLLANRAFEAMIDLPQERLIGKTVFDIYRRNYAKLIARFDSATLKDGGGANYQEYEVETPKRGILMQGGRSASSSATRKARPSS